MSVALAGFAIFTVIAVTGIIVASDQRSANICTVLFVLGFLGLTVIANVKWVEEYRAAKAIVAAQAQAPTPARDIYWGPPPQFPSGPPRFVAMDRPATGAAAPPAVPNPYAHSP